MGRWFGILVCVLGLTGCTATSDSAWWREWAGLSGSPQQYHFEWQIAGDPSVAPLQVFDDGRRTWLQYPADHPVPAIFQRDDRGDVLKRPWREGDYLVVNGVPGRLVVRGGLLEAQAWRLDEHDGAVAGPVGVAPEAPAGGHASMSVGPVGARDGATPHALAPASAPPASTGLPGSVSSAPRSAPLPPALPMGSAAAARPDRLLPPGSIDRPDVTPSEGLVSEKGADPHRTKRPRDPVAAVSSAVRSPSSSSYAVTPADGTIRQALHRWAPLAGWTFNAEHWAVDVDIPIAGSASFGKDFRPAVRDLLAATELGDRPLQPCFYVNQVLRVVPLSGRCDRTRSVAQDAAEVRS